jgi:hypothetical protein
MASPNWAYTNLCDHVPEHFFTMARRHAANRYDHRTRNVETIVGSPATGIRDFLPRSTKTCLTTKWRSP